MMKLENKNETVNVIINELAGYSYQDKIEILANLFLNIGVEVLESEGLKISSDIKTEELFLKATRDIKQRGNTLGNSLIIQGFTILEWLHRE